jgi:hypothetical protein
MMHLSFRELPVGARFTVNGNDWLKASTRTAKLNGNGRTFYFGQNEVVRTDPSELEPNPER